MVSFPRIPGKMMTGKTGLMLGILPYLQVAKKDQRKPLETALSMMMREKLAQEQTNRFLLGLSEQARRQQESLRVQIENLITRLTQSGMLSSAKELGNIYYYNPESTEKFYTISKDIRTKRQLRGKAPPTWEEVLGVIDFNATAGIPYRTVTNEEVIVRPQEITPMVNLVTFLRGLETGTPNIDVGFVNNVTGALLNKHNATQMSKQRQNWWLETVKQSEKVFYDTLKAPLRMGSRIGSRFLGILGLGGRQ
ncbi:MAG: hypothetical protein DRZ76_01955 [Candidatus Nealsonbacteria bacterium]|nr:MAG: hypothetical protein DRZ76_01955 [Candidatus Nealsonbacteria bacterium]